MKANLLGLATALIFAVSSSAFAENAPAPTAGKIKHEQHEMNKEKKEMHQEKREVREEKKEIHKEKKEQHK